MMELPSNLVIVGAGLFFISIVIIELLRFSARHLGAVKSLKVRRRIKKYSDPSLGLPKADADIVSHEIMSDIPLLNRIIRSFPPFRSLNRLTKQANSKLPLGVYVLLSLLLCGLFFWGVFEYTHNRQLAALAAVAGIIMPFFYLIILRRKRLGKLRTQLPEGLELMARALKSGYALSGSMEMVGEEFSDPLGTEFQKTISEINFGISTQQALKNFAERAQCPEANFFVVAVILQRETGGNLAELLDNLAELLRKKFEFMGKVRALSAESKFSAVILALLPLLIALYMQMTMPGYLNVLFTHPVGQKVLGVCAVLMLLGIITMAKLVDIKV